MKKCKRGLALVLAAAALLGLSGCGSGSIDRLFSLPQPADEYLQLQELIDAEIAQGCEYAAPTGGSYRQSVQLCDLDGDGESEALAFLRDAGQNGKINIYKLSHGRYQLVLTLVGEGSAIGAIDFSDLNGDGFADLTVSWQLGTELRMLTVYDLSGWGGEKLLTTDCTEFLVSDMDGDGTAELLVVSLAAAGGGAVSLYSFVSDGEPESRSARLSAGVTVLQRLRACSLEGGVPALLAESFCTDGALVSDLFALRNGEFVNVTLDAETGVSRARRTYAVYSSDIDGDHCIEIPSPTSLFTQSQGSNFWSIAWIGYDINGKATEKLDTYHCYSDGWYLILPQGWHDTLTVRRDDSVSGERSVVLSDINRSTGEITDKLIIYTLTGENRAERAQLDGRFVILEEESTVYAAQIIGDITPDEVKACFRIIYTEWSTGAV